MENNVDATAAEPGLATQLLRRIARIEVIVAVTGVVGAVVLVAIEPNVLEAPFENANTVLFTFGGTLLAVATFVAMLWFRVPPVVRIVVLAVPSPPSTGG